MRTIERMGRKEKERQKEGKSEKERTGDFCENNELFIFLLTEEQKTVSM